MKRNFAAGIGILCSSMALQLPADAGTGSAGSPPKIPTTESGVMVSLSDRPRMAHDPAQTSPASRNEHTVRTGDTLEKISRLHGCSVAALLEENGLKAESIIHPGRKLKLPAPIETRHVTPETSPGNPPLTATHRVAPGETFASIARQHHIPLDTLLSANPDIKPTALRPGQTIHLGQACVSPASQSPDTGSSRRILAANEPDVTTAPPVSPPTVKIQPVTTDRQMTYHEFASRQGTNTRRLNQLNGLDLLDSALLAKGSELLAPAQP